MTLSKFRADTAKRKEVPLYMEIKMKLPIILIEDKTNGKLEKGS